MTTKNTAKTKQQKDGPIRLNLNIRTRSKAANATWKHYQGLSFICEAANRAEAAAFAGALREKAMALAVSMRMTIPGAIYLPQPEADHGIEENQTSANPPQTRAEA